MAHCYLQQLHGHALGGGLGGKGVPEPVQRYGRQHGAAKYRFVLPLQLLRRSVNNPARYAPWPRCQRL